MAKAGTALAKRANTLPANWEEEMNQYVKGSADAAASMGGGQNYLSIRAGVLKYDGNAIKGGELDCVVLAYVFENAYYEGEWDADNPTTPVCFAFGAVKGGEDGATVIARMAPHDDSPGKQHDACKGCPQNEFGTAEKGKGKACKNTIKLALIHADDVKKGNIEDAPVFFLKVPPTSNRAWKAHIQKITNVLQKPECGVVTKLRVRPDEKTQVAVEFDLVSEVSKDQLGRLFVRGRKMLTEMMQPYQKMDAPKGKAKGKPAAKKPAGKPAAEKPAAKKKAGGKAAKY